MNDRRVRIADYGAECSESLLSAHIDRPVPVLRIRKALCYRLHFRKGRSPEIVKHL